MDFALSEMQTMLLDSAERLLAANSGVEYWRTQRDGALGFDEARWQQFAELGWLALPVPEDAGGLGGSHEDVALLNIALGRSLATEPYVSSAVVAAHILGTATDNETAQIKLGEIATGEYRVALASLEPGGDPLSCEPRGVVARREGNGFVLSGRKIVVADAGSAQGLIVSARIEGEPGTALFLIDVDTADAEHYPLIDGTRAADIVLDGVVAGEDALLASGVEGAAILEAAITRGNVARMAQAVGSMEACLTLCGDYAKERKQFGAAIGSFQAIQHLLADMFVAAHQARSMLYHAIAHADNADAEARRAALSAARLVVGEAGQLVSRNGIQIHGGYGLTDEYAVSHHFRRLMCLEKVYGDIADHTARLGASLFAPA